MAIMMYLAIGITFLNLSLLLALLGVYYQNYRRIQASINLGLLIFAGVFVVQKLVALYLLFSMMDFQALIGMPMFVLEVIETFAFAAILWISLR